MRLIDADKFIQYLGFENTEEYTLAIPSIREQFDQLLER